MSDEGIRRKARLVFGRQGEVYYSADHYKNFVQICGPRQPNGGVETQYRLRDVEPELRGRIVYLVSHFDECGWTPTFQGGAMGFGMERSLSGDLVLSSERMRVPGKYLGQGLPKKPDFYYTEADVWPMDPGSSDD